MTGRAAALLLALGAATSCAAAPTPAESEEGFLEEREHGADDAATLCDPVKQYSGYFKLHTGTPALAKNYVSC